MTSSSPELGSFDSGSASRRAAALAFLTAAITLFVQVLVHRMIQARLLNNYAFLVISLTMLGFAFAGVVLTCWQRVLPRRLEDGVTSAAALFVLTLLAASSAFYHAALGRLAWSRSEFVVDLLRTLPFALLFAVPFVFSGLILGALLAAPRLPARRTYFFDLLGSALGAFAVIPAISRWGVEESTLGAGAVLLTVTVLLARPRSLASRLLAGGAGLALIGSAAGLDRVLPPPGDVEYFRWDPIARIELRRAPALDPGSTTYPCLIGSDRQFHGRLQRILTQNNYAFTLAPNYDGTRESMRGIEETIYAAAYQVNPTARPKVAVIGVGGGIDVLAALYFDASEVTGVEVNGATVEILRSVYRDYFRPWVEEPRVNLVLDEGRHFLARTTQRYDVLQLSGVDSYSGTPAAAHVFSENYLYTDEAFDLYLSRLSDQGVLNVMRLEHIPPREMLRALVTAVGALRRHGIERPSDHVVTVTAIPPRFTALLVKRSPFTAAEIARLKDWAANSAYFEISAAPGLNETRSNEYQRFLSLGAPRIEAAYVATTPFDIRSVNDDRPFFFRHSFWWHLFTDIPAVSASIPAMEISVILLLAITGACAVACVYVPLRYLTRRDRPPPGTRRYGVVFAAVGLGYLAIEIALLQKFGLFLGHPNFSLSVVLAAMLMSSGLGSLASRRAFLLFGGLRYWAYLLSAVVLIEHFFVFPRLAGWVGLGFPARVGVACLSILPIGFCLGVFFPSALDRLKSSAPSYVPWAWGLNGIFSVLAPVVSIAFSMTFGISLLLILSLPLYLIAAFSLPAGIADPDAR